MSDNNFQRDEAEVCEFCKASAFVDCAPDCPCNFAEFGAHLPESLRSMITMELLKQAEYIYERKQSDWMSKMLIERVESVMKDWPTFMNFIKILHELDFFKTPQDVIDYLENNVPVDILKRITTKESSFDKKKYIDYVDPLIYSNNGRWLTQEIGKPKNYFGLSKPLSPGLIQKDLWFHQFADDETKKQFDVWLAGINLLQEKIDPMYFNKSVLKVDNDKEYSSRWDNIVKEYSLQNMIQPKDQNDRHIIWGPVGIWSTPYYVKPSKHVF